MLQSAQLNLKYRLPYDIIFFVHVPNTYESSSSMKSKNTHSLYNNNMIYNYN